MRGHGATPCSASDHCHSACLIFALCGTWQSSRVSGSGAPRVSGSSIAAHALARKLTALSSTHGHAGCICPMCSTAGAATPPKRAEVEHSPSATPRCVVGNLVRARLRLRDRIRFWVTVRVIAGAKIREGAKGRAKARARVGARLRSRVGTHFHGVHGAYLLLPTVTTDYRLLTTAY